MRNIALLCILCCSYSLLQAQADRSKADDLYANEQWKDATEAYINYLKTSDTDSLAYFNLGMSYLNLSEYDRAISNLKLAEENNFPVNFTAINIARAQLKKEEPKAAFTTLQHAAKNGAVPYMRIKKDPEFEVLRSFDGYDALLEQLKLNAYPCLSDPKRRIFDFWIGEWDVFVNGQKVGENSITMANGGCAIHESYTTGLRNYSGQSINYYDTKDKKWHQVWVGSAGGVLDYIEIDKKEGYLQFQCDFLNPAGQLVYSRLTFSKNEDGTVRQYFESSKDGEEWTPAFDGLYKKKQDN